MSKGPFGSISAGGQGFGLPRPQARPIAAVVQYTCGSCGRQYNVNHHEIGTGKRNDQRPIPQIACAARTCTMAGGLCACHAPDHECMHCNSAVMGKIAGKVA